MAHYPLTSIVPFAVIGKCCARKLFQTLGLNQRLVEVGQVKWNSCFLAIRGKQTTGGGAGDIPDHVAVAVAGGAIVLVINFLTGTDKNGGGKADNSGIAGSIVVFGLMGDGAAERGAGGEMFEFVVGEPVGLIAVVASGAGCQAQAEKDQG